MCRKLLMGDSILNHGVKVGYYVATSSVVAGAT
jgi:hypothetical protein